MSLFKKEEGPTMVLDGKNVLRDDELPIFDLVRNVALFAVTCPRCGAKPYKLCSTPSGVRVIGTHSKGIHHKRWKTALTALGEKRTMREIRVAQIMQRKW